MVRKQITIAAVFAIALAAATTAAAAADGPKPVTPQPDSAALKPGLAAKYYGTFVRHIDELKAYMSGNEGKTGEPIPNIEYNVGADPMLTHSRQLPPSHA